MTLYMYSVYAGAVFKPSSFIDKFCLKSTFHPTVHCTLLMIGVRSYTGTQFLVQNFPAIAIVHGRFFLRFTSVFPSTWGGTVPA